MIVLALLVFWSKNANAHLLFKETFDTDVTENIDLYNIRFADHRIINGNLVLFYSSLHDDLADARLMYRDGDLQICE